MHGLSSSYLATHENVSYASIQQTCAYSTCEGSDENLELLVNNDIYDISTLCGIVVSVWGGMFVYTHTYAKIGMLLALWKFPWGVGFVLIIVYLISS